MTRFPLLATLLLSAFATTAAPVDKHAGSAAASLQARIPAGSFESVLPPAPGVKKVGISNFRMDQTPVTNEQFARCLAGIVHPTRRIYPWGNNKYQVGDMKLFLEAA